MKNQGDPCWGAEATTRASWGHLETYCAWKKRYWGRESRLFTLAKASGTRNTVVPLERLSCWLQKSKAPFDHQAHVQKAVAAAITAPPEEHQMSCTQPFCHIPLLQRGLVSSRRASHFCQLRVLPCGNPSGRSISTLRAGFWCRKRPSKFPATPVNRGLSQRADQRPGQIAAEPQDLASGAAAVGTDNAVEGAAQTHLLAFLKQEHTASSGKPWQRSSRAPTSGAINGSKGHSAVKPCSMEQKHLKECLDALAAAIRDSDIQPGVPAAPAVPPTGVTESAHVQSARVAVLLLQCVLHTVEQRRLGVWWLLPHISAAADGLSASATTQLHLQQVHVAQPKLPNSQGQQVLEEEQKPFSEIWLVLQRMELVVLLKRSVRLLSSLLPYISNSSSMQKQQLQHESKLKAQRESCQGVQKGHSSHKGQGEEHQLQGSSATSWISGPPLQGDTQSSSAAAALLSIFQLLDTAVRLLHSTAKTQHLQHGVLGVQPAPAGASAIEAAEKELRHLSPLLLWLIPSLWTAAYHVGVFNLWGLWATTAHLAHQQRQQQCLQQLQLPDLSLLLIATSRVLALQKQHEHDQLQKQKDNPGLADSLASCKKQLLRLAANCSRRAAMLLSKTQGIEREAPAGTEESETSVALTAWPEQQHQQNRHQKLEEAVEKQKQQHWQRPWFRQSCIMLLGLTRLMQQEQLLLPAMLRYRPVQQALRGEQLSSAGREDSMPSSFSSDTVELVAGAAAFMTSFAIRLTAAEWLPQMKGRLQPDQARQQPCCQPSKRLHVKAAAASGPMPPWLLSESTPAPETQRRQAFPARTSTETRAQSDGLVHLSTGEQVFLSGRDFSQLLRCFVSTRFLPASLLQKSLAFIAAYPQVVTGVRQMHATNSKIPVLRLSPQDAALLLWAIGTSAASVLSPRRMQRELAAQLLRGHASKAPEGVAVAASTSGRSSITSRSCSCTIDSQAIANAVWGLTCCGLLQRRLLRTLSVSPVFRRCFRDCSSIAEKQQLLRAALLLRLQRSGAPAPNVCAAAFAARRKQSGAGVRFAGAEYGGSYVRGPRLQQVLSEVQQLLKEPAGACGALPSETAAARPPNVAVVHECAVWPGVHLDIALVQQHLSKLQQQARIPWGRLKGGKTVRRVAIEVDGPSHFLLSVRLRSSNGTDSRVCTGQQQSSGSYRGSSSSNAGVFVELWPDGGTVLKHRLLRLLGWDVLHVCFGDWQKLQGNRALQQKLLLRYPVLRELLRM
ncbi:uncharacterized protein LOC34624109 [Cyclospora cayetanensis]|uniref:Uncharacterized protein LOC34624109 n=1 Tax=Cyclospora cayetanensis TaxID=88456 RepID=A0A6P6RRG4_9EIME|nr:uncharacterized protein LOC34624109 [Cyclospora cayetanensis]